MAGKICQLSKKTEYKRAAYVCLSLCYSIKWEGAWRSFKDGHRHTKIFSQISNPNLNPNANWSSKGRGPSAPEFWEFLSIYANTLCGRTTKFDVVTHVGEGRVSLGRPPLPSQLRELSSRAPQFWAFSCIHAYTL